MSSRKKVGLLGASGFIGRHLAHALAARGDTVRALVRTPDDALPRKADCRVGSFDSPTAFGGTLDDLDVLVHAAAANTVASSARTPLQELDHDLRTTLALIEAAQDRTGLHVIFVSSGGTVYGEPDAMPPLSEAAPMAPRSYHGASKSSAELFLRALARTTPNALTVLRPSNVYGPGQSPRAGFGVIPALFQSALQQQPFEIRGSVDAVRDYLYIADFIDLLLRTIDAPAPDEPELMNAGSGRGVALNELIQRVEQVTGGTIERVHRSAVEGEISRVVLDSSRARQRLSWAATTPLEEGLSAALDWYRSNES